MTPESVTELVQVAPTEDHFFLEGVPERLCDEYADRRRRDSRRQASGEPIRLIGPEEDADADDLHE